MACVDCLENCGGNIASDQCVEYTGAAISSLGICQGDRVSKVVSTILTSLQTALDGTGVTLDDITLENCPWLLNQFIGQSPTLYNFVNLLVTANCSLKSMIDDINTQIGTSSNSGVFDVGCLTGLPTNPSSQQVLQALLTAYCITAATVAAIPSTYVKTSDLPSQVNQILGNSGVIGGTVQYAQYIPSGMAFPYFGALSAFDNTGKGLAASGLLGLYLCNGNNGTVDLRGRTIVGAIRNVPGGQPDPAVDPSLSTNPSMNYALGDKFGEGWHILLIPEIPAHIHGVIDAGHKHSGQDGTDSKGGSSGTPVLSTVNVKGLFTYQTQMATTGITIASTGGGSAHNNVQPSAAAYWVIKL